MGFNPKEQGVLLAIFFGILSVLASIVIWFDEQVWCPKCKARLRWRSRVSRQKIGSGKSWKDVTATERVTYRSGHTKTIDRTTQKLVPHDIYSNEFVCPKCQNRWSVQDRVDKY